jgi:protein-S-isoprenylcysteine O-methyltransferase Ste14
MSELLTNLLFSLFYARFAFIHTQNVLAGHWHVLPFAVQETLLAVLFFGRRPTKDVSDKWVDWVIAGVGTFTPLFLTGGVQPVPIGVPLQMVGLAGSIWALCFLGRSIGIVPANRGVVTTGPYAFVRHPMYAGHFLTLTGFFLTYPSLHNFLLIALTMVCIGFRITLEEIVLEADPVYRMYASLVRSALVPGVF